MRSINIFTLIALLIFALSAPAWAGPIGNPITSTQSTTGEGSHIFKASQGYLNSLNLTTFASAGFILVIDSATVPADGAVTPKLCYQMAATSNFSQNWGNQPIPFANGIVVVYSTTGCFTKTISNTVFMSGQTQ